MFVFSVLVKRLAGKSIFEMTYFVSSGTGPGLYAAVQSISPPPSSNRHRQNNGDCLEGKRENYQVCSVQYCVQQLCNAHTYEQTNSSLD